MAKTPTWQRKAGQNPNGGLNEAGRRSLKAAGHDIKRPQPEGGSRRDSFCARMKGMKAKLTSSETANDPDSRINKSLRAWNCADGGPVWEKDRPKGLGKPQKLTPSEKRSAKASAKAAGRPYPNLVDNMRAARADGGSVRPELGAGGDALKAALKIAQQYGNDALLALHNMKSHRLDMAEKLGGLPVPSIAITKPEQGFNRFGDITLVGGKEMATPSRLNPVYGSDIYSPRFPSLNDEQDKIFRGFTNLGNRRYVPLTMQNAVKEMKGNIRGGEGFNYGAGNVRASVTPQFKTLKDVQNARSNIVTSEEFEPHKKAAQNYLFELSDKFHPYSVYSGDPFQHTQSFAETLSDVGRGRHSAWNQDYKNLPDELKQEAVDYLSMLKNMPTEYFEAKPQRAVSLGEFAGAVVPENLMSETASRLKNLGVKEIVPFDPEKESGQVEALREFSKLHFDKGGEVRPELGAGGDVFKAAMKAAADVIRAYHGSPHKFDKFDISKIGTGEGAQAYGHGLYFADKEGVAKSYKNALSNTVETPENVDPLHKRVAQMALTFGDNTPEGAIAWINKHKFGASHTVPAFTPEVADAVRESFQRGDFRPGGHMYEVAIRANPKHLLDWDKPFNQQTSAVKERLANVPGILAGNKFEQASNDYTKAYDAYMSRPSNISPQELAKLEEDVQNSYANMQLHKGMEGSSGSRIYNMLSKNQPWSAGAEKLKQYDIPGIKYLDQVSRGAGEGSSNYVVFDPKIIDIMRRYATGGSVEHGLRIAKELGGDLEGDVSYLDTPDFEDSGSVMAKLAPSKPQKTPSEFIKQELAYGDKQLPQYDPEAGKKTGLQALEMAKMAGYLTPAAPYVAVGDFAQQMLTGEPMGAAIASAFLPGGKYAKMAGAALASQADPEEAEAGLLTPKMFRDLYQYALAHPQHADPFLRSEAFKAITSMQTPLTGKIAQPGHIYGLSHDIAPLDVVSTIRKMRGVDLLPRRQKSWLDLYNEGKGGTFIGLGGDRSRLGRMTEINGQKLGWPVDWHAGPEYMLEPNPGSVWANAEDASSTLNNQILRASRNGTRPVFGAYMPMGAQSLDSSVQMIDSILSLMHGRGKLEPKVAEEFDNMLRSGSFYPKDQESLIEKARTKFKDWPGINNPKAASDFIKKRARDADESLRVTGTDRGALVKAIDSASWNEKGFPNVGEIRVAGTNPDLLATPNNMVGYRIVQLDPDQAARSLEAASKKKFGHNTYTSDLHGSYWGDVELAPRDLAMPDSAIKILNKRKVAMQNPYGPKKPRKLGERDPETGLFPGALDKSKPFRIDHPMSPDFRGRQAFRKVSEQARKQPITQRWFDTLSEGQQRLLKEGYERGGKVEDALRLANKILSKG